MWSTLIHILWPYHPVNLPIILINIQYLAKHGQLLRITCWPWVMTLGAYSPQVCVKKCSKKLAASSRSLQARHKTTFKYKVAGLYPHTCGRLCNHGVYWPEKLDKLQGPFLRVDLLPDTPDFMSYVDCGKLFGSMVKLGRGLVMSIILKIMIDWSKKMFDQSILIDRDKNNRSRWRWSIRRSW